MALLLVDDDEDVRTIFADFLRDEGYDVLEASSSREAKQLLVEHGNSIALVLTDLRMPGETGIELAKYIHQHHADVAVVFISGDTRGADIGGEPLLRKPVSLDQLAATVSALAGQPAGETALDPGASAADIRDR